jgi:hypothetical protein
MTFQDAKKESEQLLHTLLHTRQNARALCWSFEEIGRLRSLADAAP